MSWLHEICKHLLAIMYAFYGCGYETIIENVLICWSVKL